MKWNELTSTTALAIDNDQAQLDFVLKTVANLRLSSRSEDQLRASVSQALEKHYSDNLTRACNPDSNSFCFKLAGMLLNQVIAEIQWNELAKHYITTYREYQENK
jgi:DNA-binding LytR/AlgR family response regulator